MKNIFYLAFLLCLVSVMTSCSESSSGATASGANVFIGEWSNTKKPTETWKIEKTGSSFKGTRTGPVDYFKTDTETWTRIGDPKLLKLQSTTEGGSTLIYFQDRDAILRTPPGLLYTRVQE